MLKDRNIVEWGTIQRGSTNKVCQSISIPRQAD